MITDVVADALVIFVFDGGMFGIGLATAVSYYVALIPLVCYFFRSNSILRLSFSFLSVAEWKEICKEGLIKASKRVCNTVKPVLLNSLSLLLGTSLALSAYGVTNQVRDFLISFSAGSAGAVILIGSLLHSQRDRDGLSCLSGFALKTIGIISVPGILCVAFSKSIAGFFIQDSAEVLEMASLSVRCVGIMIPFATFNGVFIAFMQITKRYRMSSVMSFLNRLIPIVTVSAVLGTLLGVNGLWWALPISEMLNAAIVLIVIRHTNGRFPRNAAEFLCLPPDFGYRPEDYIELFVRKESDVVALQERVKRFCEDHDIDRRRIVFAVLAMEELCVNVITYGFPMCPGVPSLHVWIAYEKGDIIIRIQDNCPEFNVAKTCSELRRLGPERCVGLRLVSGISKEMKYTNMLETNNLMIVI